MNRIIYFFFLFMLAPLLILAQNPNDVIINEYNEASGATGSKNGISMTDEWVELLVIANSIDLRNWYLTDEEWTNLPGGEGKLQIANNTAFANIPMGTYIVLIKGTGSDDTDPSDRLVILYTSNTNLTQSNNFNLAVDDGLTLVKDDDQVPGEKDAGEVPVDYVSWGSERDVPPNITWNNSITGIEDEDSYFSNGSSFNNDDNSKWVTNAENGGTLDNRTPGYANPGQDDSSLPVELTSFTAAGGDGSVTLRWSTASEIDNQGFVILRSLQENGDYQEISSFQTNDDLKGAGNSSQSHAYSYVDADVNNGATYWYKLVDVDINGVRTEHGPISATPQSQVINDPEKRGLPQAFYLKNYPNPFNPSTTIAFDISSFEEDKVFVRLTIFDALGKRVRSLFAGELPPALHRFQWNGLDDLGRPAPSGIYVYNFKTAQLRRSHKMLLLR